MIKKTIYVVVALSLVVMTIYTLKINKEANEKRVFRYDKDKAISVKAMMVSYNDSASVYSYSGTFEPFRESKISADFQGRVNEVLVDVGYVVDEGQVLVELDNALLKLQLQSTEIQIEGLRADVSRYTVLAGADAVQGIQLEKAELGLKTAQIQKATLLEQISKTSVRAPFRGIITAKMTEEGAFAVPGMPLLQVTDISSLRFTVNIGEDKLSQFQQGQHYQVRADVFPELVLSGDVTLVSSKSNVGNSYPVQLTIDNTEDHRIKSGMFGKVTVSDQSQAGKLVIPSFALVGTAIHPQVYVVREGKAILRNLTISARMEDKVTVDAGISEGEMIVTSGFINLFDGAPVNIK